MSRVSLLLAALLAAILCLSSSVAETPRAEEHAAGFALIRTEDIKEYVDYFAGPTLEGRDSPSRGLSVSARYLAKRLEELGLDCTSDSAKVFRASKKGYRPWLSEEDLAVKTSTSSGTYLRPWTKAFISPVPKRCSLKLASPAKTFQYGLDFVPIASADGSAKGELVFCGYGISSKGEDYDDLKGLKLSGKVAILFEGEPEDDSKFDGARISKEASIWSKVEVLAKEKVAGILVVRRDPKGTDGTVSPGPAFRFTQAIFNGERERDLPPRKLPPMLVISESCATEVLGTNATELRKRIDQSGQPAQLDLDGRRVSFKVKTELVFAALDNVVGVIRGSDPKLNKQYVVIGAHYDHTGVGPRGRTDFGADDNASGTSALLEVIEALVESKPRRSILCVFFSAEEDGLLGSKAFCRNLPVDKKKLVAMVNLDMIGRGPTEKVAVLGLKQNPKLKELVERANTLATTGVNEIEVCRDDSLFKRSDHYSFHKMLAVPTVFFLEDYPVENNADYHTWRDTIERLNVQKVTNTAKLAFNTIWLLANEDGRPPRPKF